MESLVGKTIAGYQVVELIDDTARTLVYKGYHPGEDRYVVVKVLKAAAAADPAVVQSLAQYIQLAAKMQHPNILPVLASGQENGAHYLVTPFMEHRSIAQHLSVYHDLYQAQVLLEGIVSGLEYIYAQGYVHGNLRPSNILTGDQWQPLLEDFSIAMRVGETPTPYNSPEQVQGGIVDRRTDVYALGVILYELLTGQAPAPGMVFNLAAKRPDLPQSVERLILKATAQNPEQRFQTPREVLNALQMADSKPAATPAPQPTPQTQQIQQPRRSSNFLSGVIGAIAVLIMILCLVLVLPRLMSGQNPQPGVTQPVAGQPIQPPEVQPTQPPAVNPTQPPQQEPPTQEPPQAEQPIESAQPTAGGSGGPTLPPVCGSLGVGSGIVIMGGALKVKRRKPNRDNLKEAYQ